MRVRSRFAAVTLVVLAVTSIPSFIGLAPASTDRAPTPRATAQAAAAPANTRLTVNGSRWFASGANLPWFAYRCDFGCRGRGGVVANRATIDAAFARLRRAGMHTVRWYAFPGDAWQIRRGTDNYPLTVRKEVYADLAVALELAERHDLYLDLVLFEDTRTIPATWITDATQRAALARALAPLFSRHATNRHLLAWEIFNEPERGLDDPATAATLSLEAMRDTVAQITSQVHARSRAMATVGSTSVDRIGLWTGLGLDFYAPHSLPGMVGGQCALCTPRADIAAAYGVDRPVVVGALDGGNAAADLTRLYDTGYAGAWFWARTAVAHPSNPQRTAPSLPYRAANTFIHAHTDVGPRSRVLNPCEGPDVSALLCPDLRMSPPTNFTVRRRNGRTLLLSRNSLNSRGLGPAELHGRRSGRYTMRATQRITRRGGGKLTVRTGAQLLFKRVPGQYRYWKWRNAATFELWQLDGRGRPVRLMRRGPKTVYCLRDLALTKRSLPGAPRRYVYPGCSQRLSQQRVTLGTSVGWSDIYPASYNENWIDVTGLRGCYAYVHIADPTNVMYEYNESNNRTAAVVRLPWKGTARGCPNARNVAAGAPGGY